LNWLTYKFACILAFVFALEIDVYVMKKPQGLHVTLPIKVIHSPI